ncbi:MAG: hypothetical protein J2P18_05375 [Nocardia sp.]|nr:hypothetical protein [Nocardia sp.]
MVAPGSTTLLRSHVEVWNVPELTAFADAISTANNETFQVNIDNAKKFFNDVGTSWQGAAYNAAYDRVGEDHDQARRVWTYVDDLVNEIRTAASDIGSHRTVLLGKLADAREAGLIVGDNWMVSEKEGVSADVINAHQEAINGAFYPFSDAVATAGTKIAEAAELVRASGDLFGSDIDVAEANTQGGRLGDEDGREAADAARNGDKAKMDEVAAHLPTYVLTPNQMQDLSAGKDVPGLPADVQDYYKHFFASAGKDGVLALNDQLKAEATGTSDHPASAAAEVQQRALADGMMAVSNEHVGTGIGPDGKLTSPGAYTNLPPDIRQLISGRAEDREYSGTPNPTAERQDMLDRARLGNLLGKADPTMVGGTTFSTEVARQGASMASYVDNVDKNMGGNMPPGFQDGDKDTIKNSATELLGAGVKNHAADYQLMTGRDATTGDKLPADLSFGAQGDRYGAHGGYDPRKFNSIAFGHDWGDQGKTASGLYDWTADHVHDQGPEGDLARKTISALPDIVAPKDYGSLATAEDGKTIFQHNADNFNKNPELANSLARVSASDINAFAGIGDAPNAPQPAAPLDLEGSKRLAFLASQTRDGRETLDLARQTYGNAVMYQVTHDPSMSPTTAHDTVRSIAALDAHINDSMQNAQIYQSYDVAAKHNEQAQQSHDDHKEIGDNVKKVVDAIPVPGGKAVSTVKDILEDQAYKGLMSGVNPDPTPEKVQYPSVEVAKYTGETDFRNRMAHHWGASPDDIVKYGPIYDGAYESTISDGLVKDNSSLEQLSTGGAQEPGAKKKQGS